MYTYEENICIFRLTNFQRKSRSYKTTEQIFISFPLNIGNKDPKQTRFQFLTYILVTLGQLINKGMSLCYFISSITWCSSNLKDSFQMAGIKEHTYPETSVVCYYKLFFLTTFKYVIQYC